jgi:hypothetical protein
MQKCFSDKKKDNLQDLDVDCEYLDEALQNNNNFNNNCNNNNYNNNSVSDTNTNFYEYSDYQRIKDISNATSNLMIENNNKILSSVKVPIHERYGMDKEAFEIYRSKYFMKFGEFLE